MPSPDLLLRLMTPGLLRPDTLAGPITVLARGWEEDEEAEAILLSPSLGAVEEGGGEVTDDLALSVWEEEARL